ncbi:hypothetical protein [Caulobacter sp.]|uniref:hypothetical protein n=1 Tax=Caulobacter sp. TaxID=78 RepID=UPI003BAA7AE1
MSAERRGNPFGWILLGFVVGVLATFGAILFLTAGMSGYDDGPEMRSAADDAASAAMATPSSTAQTPHQVDRVEVPVEPAPPPATASPDRATPPIDAQMADDAAAAGMTSRATPN